MSNIFILSAPIQSGKTSALLNFIENKKNIFGFLCPDINGVRNWLNIASQQYYPFQKMENFLHSDIKIGKFVFDGYVFKKAQELLQKIPSNFDFYIIDEIGKLELKNEGFEPFLAPALEQLKNHKGKVILVVRDYLLADVISKYGLEKSLTISIKDLENLY